MPLARTIADLGQSPAVSARHVAEAVQYRSMDRNPPVVSSRVGASIAMTYTWRWAALFTRVIVGLIFGMAGFWKVFTLTPMGHAQKFFTGPYADSWIPYWMLLAAGVTVPFIELIAGWLLVFGLFRRTAAIALGFVLVLVTYGHLLKDALYSPQGHIFPRTLLLIPALILSAEQDDLSLDYLLLRRRKNFKTRPQS